MALFGRLRMESRGGSTGFLTSEPRGPAELRDRVVLVNSRTLTCINWLRQEPYVRAWSQAYRDDRLIVIGGCDCDGSSHAGVLLRARDQPRAAGDGLRSSVDRAAVSLNGGTGLPV